jgi:septal ring factor EnvC (AmiA/AmiB activator)
MIRVFIVLILLIVSFVSGLFFERYQSGEIGKLNERLSSAETESESLAKQNENLKQTLQLVKRQIQTDRIAYKQLQDTIDLSQGDREALKEKLEAQRQLLKKLREKLETLDS